MSYSNVPKREPEPTELDLKFNEIRKMFREVEDKAKTHDEVVATIVVNCKEGRSLHGIVEYDESRSLLYNIMPILEKVAARHTLTCRMCSGEEKFPSFGEVGGWFYSGHTGWRCPGCSVP